jgi:hypothetical protein
MKQVIVVILLVIFGAMCWRLGTSLSSDALGMAVGIVFGVLAGIPTTLLVMASERRRRPYDDDDEYEDAQMTYRYQEPGKPVEYITYNSRQPYPYQPPVIVLVAPPSGPPPIAQREAEIQRYQAQPPAQQGRVFRIVGEREEWTGGDDAR